MVILGLIGLSLAMIDPPAPSGPSPEDLKAYQSERRLAGRDAAAHVRLALWCERRGMSAERLKHLAIAVMADPSNAAARGLLGFVSDHGAWIKADQAAEKAKADDLAAARREYANRRSKLRDDADSNWKMSLWCSEKGLSAESSAHLYRVVRLDPSREDAWKRLGYKRHDGRWRTDAQIAAARVEADVQAKADRHWRPILERAKGWLGEKAHREKGEKILGEIVDPRVVPMVIAVLGNGGAQDQSAAARVLGQIDASQASTRLAILAVFGRSNEVKKVATETLRQRDPREFASILVSLIRDPIRYSVKPSGTPGKPGELLIEGPKYDRSRRYQSLPGPTIAAQAGDRIAYDENGLPILVRPIDREQNIYFIDPTIFQRALQQRQLLYQAESECLQTLLRTSIGPVGLPSTTAGVHSLSTPNHSVAVENALPRAGTSSIGADVAALYRAKGGTLPFLCPAFSDQELMVLAIEEPFTLNGTMLEVTRELDARIPVGRMALEARKSAARSAEQLKADVARLDAFNAPIHKQNARCLSVLKEVTGQDLGEDSKAWGAWLTDLQGMAWIQPQATARETIVEDVQSDYQPVVPPTSLDAFVVGERVRRHSCFAAGTPVRTLSGPRPIESLALGDQVLTQDTTSGTLSYQPILAVYHNPPNGTLKIDLGDDAIVCTGIHRLWSPGRGWVMARDLKPGDPLRTIGGVASIRSIEKDATQKVFNLEVAAGQSFFVGEKGLLVHDNSVVSPTAEPFDGPKAVAAAKSAD